MSIPSIGELFLKRITQNPKKNVIGTIENNEIKFVDFAHYYEQTEKLAFAYQKLGLRKGSRVGILSATRYEWHYSDLASVLSNMLTIPIYPTYCSEDIFYILDHAEIEILFVENKELLEKVKPLISKLTHLKNIILYDSKGVLEKELGGITLYDFSKIVDQDKAPKDFLKNSIAKLDTSAPASIIYTSGTTGVPKGAVITGDALAQALNNIKVHFNGVFTSVDRTLTWLPFSHVFGRFESFLPLAFNWEMVFAESIDKLIDNLAIAKPTVMVSVPRIFEKIYAKIMTQIEGSSFFKKKLFHLGEKIGFNFFDSIDQDISPSSSNFLLRKVFYKVVFSKIYNKFGGRIRYFISGGAPLSPKIIKFLRNCNLTVLEGYGLTETAAASFANPPARQVPGTVGLPLGDVQVSFDTDGEILIKSKAIFQEYYKNPEETKKAMIDGWFRTGDIGELDGRGYLKITGRKKDIIVTAGGKNVAPQKIESKIKSKKYISQCAVFGDKRKYLTVLIGLEKEDFHGVEDEFKLGKEYDYEELSNNEQVQRQIQLHIDEINSTLSHFETIKYFKLIPEEVSVDTGLLTPSLKIKKKHVFEKYKALLDSMYH